ncbi:hypothetical protein GCK72_002091 [Caenorhabditis remanei]|uniref:Major sperm protein n=1 Tax=Caenorhabditis remanei TaxID=31234 RepID=A0A6A5HVG9_CAERE|nr:hypothetical protein GCK72_002091 [Caenorhabditis remanei]KAF1770273.1 hypothetical protein GCK72_002091 [Caenorhabditis remanei]
MAQESIGKRSIRREFDHAGGDNLQYQKEEYLENEESHLNVEMIERESDIQGQEHRYLGGLIGNKELIILSSLGVCMYLVNGEYAQSVCTALTSVPPAVLSYRVLTNQQTTKQGYHTILFYWTIYGLIALIDQFIGSAQGYNLCKGGLLGVIFLHAVRSNSAAIPPALNFMNQVSADIITSIFTRYGSDGSLVKTGPRTPTMTQFSDDSLRYIFSESEVSENGKIEMSTAHSFMPSLEMQSTQRMSTGSEYMKKSISSEMRTMKIEEESSCQSSANDKHQINFQSMSALTMTQGNTPDIVTIPADHITFTGNNREEIVQVTNVSPLHIMFALKTNANTYLIAAPTSGILFSGQSMKIRVGVTENYFDDCSDPGVSIDKSQNRRRLAVRVFYA